jgi:hypothetical protein
MMWNNVPHLHTIFVLDHGVKDCIFVVAWRDKITFSENNLKFFFSILSINFFHTICHDVHVCKLHLYDVC